MGLGDAERSMDIAVNINPGLMDDPGTAVALGGLPAKDAEDISSFAIGQQIVEQEVDYLRGLKHEDQWNRWKRMDTQTQKLYTRLTGFQVSPYEDKSNLRKVTRFLGAVGNIIDPADGVEKVVGGAIGAMNWASDEATHTYRFLREDDGVSTPSEMADAWRATANGEKYYREEDQHEIRKITGDEHYDLVIALAAGKSPAEYLQEKGVQPGGPNWEQQLLTVYGLTQNDKIKDALNKATESKISPGRDLASIMGASRGEVLPGWIPIVGGKTEFEAVSGMFDATFRFVADPTLIGGKANKIYKVSRYGMRPGEELSQIVKFQDLHRTGKAGRYGIAAERIAKGFSEGTGESLQRLIHEMPGIQPAMRALTDWHAATPIKTADDVFDFYKEGAGFEAVMSGRFANRLMPIQHGVHFLPAARVWTPLTGAAKDAIETGVDKVRFMGQDGKWVSGKWNPVKLTANGIYQATHMLPKTNFINPASKDSFELYKQLLEFNLPKGVRGDLLADYVFNSKNYAMQANAIQTTTLMAMAEASGTLATAKGAKFWNRWIHRANQAYATGDLDKVILPSGDEIRVGLWPDQMENMFAIPSFKEYLKIGKEHGKLLQTTQNTVEAYMSNVWKPAVLLRVGFIPRAFGEEMLWALAHFGPGAAKNALLLRSAKKELEVPGLFARPFLAASGKVADALDTTRLGRPMSSLDAMARLHESNLTRHIRAFAAGQLPDSYHVASTSFAQHQPTVNSVFMENFSASNHWGMGTPPNTNSPFYVHSLDENGELQRVELNLHDFEHADDLTESTLGRERSLVAMNHYRQEGVRKILADAGARWMHPNEVTEVITAAKAAGLEIESLNDLRKLVPENMPASWDRFLDEDLGDAPDEAATLLRTLSRQKMTKAMQRRRHGSHDTGVVRSDVENQFFEAFGDDPIGRQSQSNTITNMDEAQLRSDLNEAWFMNDHERAALIQERLAQLADDDGIEDLFELATGAAPDTPLTREGLEPDLFALRNVMEPTTFTPHDPEALLNFIESLPAKQRSKIFGRHGALERHARSQNPGVPGKLIDPHNMPEEMVEDLFDRIEEKLQLGAQDDAYLRGGMVSDALALRKSRFEQKYGEAIDAGQTHFVAAAKAAAAADIDRSTLKVILEELREKWKGEGYTGMWHPIDQRYVSWDGPAGQVRQTVARSERAHLDKYYDAMDRGDAVAAEEALVEVLASRMQRGDMEKFLQDAYLTNFSDKGISAAAPVAKGHHRVYTLTVAQQAEEASKLIRLDPMLENADVPFRSITSDQAIEMGMPGVPGQAWFTADPEQVKRLKQAMEAKDMRPSIAYVDLPDKQFNKGRSLARTQMTGGMEATADVRQMSQVFVDPNYRTRLTPLNSEVRGMGMFRDRPSKIDDLKAELDRVDQITAQQMAKLDEGIAKTQERMNAYLPGGQYGDMPDDWRQPSIVRHQAIIDDYMTRKDALLNGTRVDMEAKNYFEMIMDELGGEGMSSIPKIPNDVTIYRKGNGVNIYMYWDENLEPIGGVHYLPGHTPVHPSDPGGPAGLIVSMKEGHAGQGIGPKMYEAVARDLGKGDAAKGARLLEEASGTTGFSHASEITAWKRRHRLKTELQQAIDNPTLADGLDRDELVRALAQKQMKDFNNTFSNPLDHEDPRDMRDALAQLARGDELTTKSVKDIAPSNFPDELAVPTVVLPSNSNFWKRGVDWGFNKIGQAGNALIREPLFQYLSHQAYGMVAPGLRKQLLRDETVQIMDEMAHAFKMDGPRVMADWSRLPEEVRFAANPMEAARELGLNLNEKWRKLDPNKQQRLNMAAENWNYAEKHITDVAMDRAIGESVPYLDDHRLRSQFNDKFTNLLPFRFAEDQFIKRWVRTFAEDTAQFEKAVLLMHGLRHTGYVEQNEYGEDVFTMPGSELFMIAVNKGLQTITGNPGMIPVPNPFTGTMRYALAGGLDRIGMPSPGPLIGIPLSLTKKFFPEMSEDLLGGIIPRAEQIAYGEQGVQSALRQVIPTSIMNTFTAATGDIDKDPRMASALTHAMAYMEASGLAPADDATADEKQTYMDRLRSWSRATILMRGAMQFFAPTTPGMELPGDEGPKLSKEFRDLLQVADIDTATQIFLSMHPDGEPWTVFASESISGAPLPATDKAYEVMTENDAFFQAHPDAGPWLLPQTKESDPFSRKAYYQQFADGMRKRKLPNEYWRDVQWAQAAQEYFDGQKTHNIALEGLASSSQREEERANWKTWKDEYFRMHPVFAEMLQSPDGKMRRQRIVADIESALNDPRAPKVDHAPAVKELVEGFRTMQKNVKAWDGDNSRLAREMKQAEKDDYNMWAEKFIRTNPQARAFYERAILPDLGVEDM